MPSVSEPGDHMDATPRRDPSSSEGLLPLVDAEWDEIEIPERTRDEVVLRVSNTLGALPFQGSMAGGARKSRMGK